MRLVQQPPNCSDFDVILPGEDSPALRILLPERLMCRSGDLACGVHRIPGRWSRTKKGLAGTFTAGTVAEFSVEVEPAGSELGVRLKVKNLTSEPWSDVRVEICSAANHLPGSPSWANAEFVPPLPLDRDLQGRFWFEKVTPRNLHALTDHGWVEVHPHPHNPSADAGPHYSFVPSTTDDAFACAVCSQDGKRFFYQAWDARCLYITPCPGNACMHLWPLVARTLEPGQSCAIRGVVGIFEGA